MGDVINNGVKLNKSVPVSVVVAPKYSCST